MLAQNTARSLPPLASRIDGVVVGRVVGVETSGVVAVTFPGAPEHGLGARAMTRIGEEDLGREVALMFEESDPQRPVVVGKMVSPLAAGQAEATADGQRIEIKAEEELVLRCGESSITLTRAGKIVIRGAYVLSRSSGVNRIQGGSVEIN
ncbi:DUF6484 domain-containing protein [Sorangium sp. So ce1014]|uniref:DUF6484 domain-containing protein n=1 Tax=Sorangium sp. So ce1014 TaxID=3133326 RepID=UPI003F613181